MISRRVVYTVRETRSKKRFAGNPKIFRGTPGIVVSTNLAEDELWVQHALRLARFGQGAVEPNPMVGAVVLAADGRLVGEGWHQKYGGPHAEVHALELAGTQARGGTLYATLEPCCHVGKTPPCTEAVLKSGVRRVVVAMADPFPQVAGGGLAILREAGLEVAVGVWESDARKLIAPYLKLLRAGKPWVIAKWAMTLDGKISTHTGDSKWISSEASRARVHELRGRVDAIIVGRGTVVADDPLLTARPSGLRVATRVVISSTADLPEVCQLRSTAREVPVMIFTSEANVPKLRGWAEDGAEVVGLPHCDSVLSVDQILKELGCRRMTNVMVEGGAGVLGTFLDAGEIDEVWAFVAPKIVGGASATSPVGGRGLAKMNESIQFGQVVVETIGDDVLIRARFIS